MQRKTAPSPAQAAQASPGGSIPAGPANGPQSLSETGSTLLFPVLRSWAAAYRQQHANVSVATAATGSGKGIAKASAGQVDQVTAVRIQVSPRPGQAQVSPCDLGEAGARINRLRLDAIQMEYLTAEVLRAGLALVEAANSIRPRTWV